MDPFADPLDEVKVVHDASGALAALQEAVRDKDQQRATQLLYDVVDSIREFAEGAPDFREGTSGHENLYQLQELTLRLIRAAKDALVADSFRSVFELSVRQLQQRVTNKGNVFRMHAIRRLSQRHQSQNVMQSSASQSNNGSASSMSVYVNQAQKRLDEVRIKRSGLHHGLLSGGRPLLEAAKHDDIDALQQLLQHGSDSEPVNFDFQDAAGLTALHWAVRAASLRVVRLLLRHRTLNVNQQDDQGWTAMHYAAFYGLTDITRELLQHPDLDPFVRDRKGKKAKHVARTNIIRLHLKGLEKVRKSEAKEQRKQQKKDDKSLRRPQATAASTSSALAKTISEPVLKRPSQRITPVLEEGEEEELGVIKSPYAKVPAWLREANSDVAAAKTVPAPAQVERRTTAPPLSAPSFSTSALPPMHSKAASAGGVAAVLAARRSDRSDSFIKAEAKARDILNDAEKRASFTARKQLQRVLSKDRVMESVSRDHAQMVARSKTDDDPLLTLSSGRASSAASSSAAYLTRPLSASVKAEDAREAEAMLEFDALEAELMQHVEAHAARSRSQSPLLQQQQQPGEEPAVAPDASESGAPTAASQNKALRLLGIAPQASAGGTVAATGRATSPPGSSHGSFTSPTSDPNVNIKALRLLGLRPGEDPAAAGRAKSPSPVHARSRSTSPPSSASLSSSSARVSSPTMPSVAASASALVRPQATKSTAGSVDVPSSQSTSLLLRANTNTAGGSDGGSSSFSAPAPNNVRESPFTGSSPKPGSLSSLPLSTQTKTGRRGLRTEMFDKQDVAHLAEEEEEREQKRLEEQQRKGSAAVWMGGLG